jgi:hypothetical protein
MFGSIPLRFLRVFLHEYRITKITPRWRISLLLEVFDNTTRYFLKHEIPRGIITSGLALGKKTLRPSTVFKIANWKKFMRKCSPRCLANASNFWKSGRTLVAHSSWSQLLHGEHGFSKPNRLKLWTRKILQLSLGTESVPLEIPPVAALSVFCSFFSIYSFVC